ncbi:somatostatin receptor type 3-like [Asterias amurensis]|uniref:somatostatin receptor type 3-like n=1 Tax=Asterias amurensis TaxID=7602 RepID=UPI003AB6A43F
MTIAMTQQNTTDGESVYDEVTIYWGNFADSQLVSAFYGIVCTLGILGNLLAVFVLLRVPSLRTNTSDLLVHLSLVDCLVCVLVIPFKLVPTTGAAAPHPGLLGELICRLYISQYIFWVCSLTSILCLVTVNLERYIAIVYPHKYKLLLTRRKKYLMIASCWIIAAMEQSFSVFLYGEDEEVGCKFLDWPSPGFRIAIGIPNVAFYFFGPFALMTFMQWRVITTLNRQVNLLKSRLASSAIRNPDGEREMWQLRTSRKLSKTLMTFVLTFAACLALNNFYYLFYMFGVHADFTSPTYHISVFLAVGNSCVNPIIYTMTNKSFRVGIRQAFSKGGDSTRVGDGTPENVALG